MHGLESGVAMRRLSAVGVFMLVALALATTHVSAARADTNTITQTAITSPADPSYFYDPTAGAFGGITVSGTTNSTSPSTDAVDIDCEYSDDGDTSGGNYTVASDVPLNADGSFSTTVPYSAIEQSYEAYGMCRLRAVPAGTAPTTGLSSFTGPRVLLAWLSPNYNQTDLQDFTLTAPQLGASNTYTSAGDCGLTAFLNDPAVFGASDAETFSCVDSTGNYWLNSGYEQNIQVDGADAFTPYFSGDESLTVAATQDPSNGNMTVQETDPIEVGCFTSGCTASGVEEDRTIRQGAGGKVVEITDSFRSTDGAAHTVDLHLFNDICFVYDCGWFVPSAVSYEFPGESGFSTHANGDTEPAGSSAPATIYVQSGIAGGAITYFTPPSGPFTFQQDYYTYYNEFGDNILFAPYALNVPAGGSAQVSFAYSTDSSQDAVAADVQTARDLQTLPTIGITSPAAGATTSSSSVTVTGQASAVTGVSSVTINGVAATLDGSDFSATVPLKTGVNTITAVVTTSSGVTASASESVTYTSASTSAQAPAGGWTGAVWLPIADTGRASRAGAVRERLTGKVTAGSGAVTYYFAYGTHGHFNHRSRLMALAAGETSRGVAVTIGGLRHGTRYGYRLIATGQYGHATGRSRSFKTTAHTK